MKHCLLILCGCQQSPGPLDEATQHQTVLDEQNFTLTKGVWALGISEDTSFYWLWSCFHLLHTSKVTGKRGWGRTRGMIRQVHMRPCMWGTQIRGAQVRTLLHWINHLTLDLEMFHLQNQQVSGLTEDHMVLLNSKTVIWMWSTLVQF